MNIQYQRTFFEQESLRKVAKAYLKCLPSDVEVLLSTGSSGCTIATAMMLLSKRPLGHVHMRKPPDMKRHNTRFVGWEFSMTGKRYAIVDDFIQSGNTLNRVLRATQDWLPNWLIPYVLVGYCGGFNMSSTIEMLEKRHGFKVTVVE